KKPPLLLELVGTAGTEIGGNAAINRVEHEHRLPFLALGGMDGRQDQIVLVEQRHAGLAGGGVWRIKREFGEEAFARRIAGSNVLELDEIRAAHLEILVDALEMRLVPCAHLPDLRRPSGRA